MANIFRRSRSRQRLIVRCMLAAALIVAIFCFGSTWPPAASADSLKDGHLHSRVPRSHQEALLEDAATEKSSAIQDSPSVQIQDDPQSSASAHSKEKDVGASDQQWTEGIRHIEALLDDEYRLKALLAPITETGEPLLRSLTHRVRAFRDVFKTWEELHIDSKDGKSKTRMISSMDRY